VLLFAADTTASMSSPIRYGIKIVDACMDYLAGIARSSSAVDSLEVVVHLIGMNDWHSGSDCSHPVELFINKGISEKAGKAIGYSFGLDKNNTSAWEQHVETVRSAIEAMARSARDPLTSGGDAREEYGTGVHFINTVIKQDKQANPDKVTKYFMVAITDDMQHGMTNGQTGGDYWPDGVTDQSVYGKNDEKVHNYACAYAPDKHPTLGFNAWKPHSFWQNLNAVISEGTTVVWCPIGSSATHSGPNGPFANWIGTLSTVFEHSNGVAISWSMHNPDKPVPSTVVHMLNTLVTKASISDALNEQKRIEQAIATSASLMTSAKQYSQDTNGCLSQVATSIDGAAADLDRVVINSGLTEALQKIFIGQSRPDPSNENDAVADAYRSLQRARENGDSFETDCQVAAAYRSLSSQCAPPPAVESFVPKPAGDCLVYGMDDDEDEGGAPCYSSLSACAVDLDGPIVYPSKKVGCYRSLASPPSGGGGPEPTYRSMSAPPPTPTRKGASLSSKNRLMRLCTGR
jgi:hypothetical protein